MNTEGGVTEVGILSGRLLNHFEVGGFIEIASFRGVTNINFILIIGDGAISIREASINLGNKCLATSSQVGPITSKEKIPREGGFWNEWLIFKELIALL